LLRSIWVFNQFAYRDKKVVGVFVQFRAPLMPPAVMGAVVAIIGWN
jgi:hypothetical protein